jgi:hypothetical protein
VAADDGDWGVRGFGGGDACEETGGPDDVEGSDTENAFGVVYASLFEGGGDDGDGGVDGVGDDQDTCVWCYAGDSGCEVADDGGIGLSIVCQNNYTPRLLNLR